MRVHLVQNCTNYHIFFGGVLKYNRQIKYMFRPLTNFSSLTLKINVVNRNYWHSNYVFCFDFLSLSLFLFPVFVLITMSYLLVINFNVFCMFVSNVFLSFLFT